MSAINSIKTPYLYPNNKKNNKPAFGMSRQLLLKHSNDLNITNTKTRNKTLKKVANIAGSVVTAVLLALTAVGSYVKNNKEAKQDSTRNYISLYNNGINGNISHKNEKAAAFINGLISQKAQLQKALGLSNEEYKNLAMLAIGIANHETCMGLDGEYFIKEKCTTICDIIKGCKGEALSKGLTNLKIGQKQIPYTQSILDKFGINSDNIYEPEKTAIATIIMLNGFKTQYEDAFKKYNIQFIPEKTLTLNEYILARYNGIPIKIQDGLFTNSTHSANIKAIILDRNLNTPKTYVGKNLHALEKN